MLDKIENQKEEVEKFIRSNLMDLLETNTAIKNIIWRISNEARKDYLISFKDKVNYIFDKFVTTVFWIIIGAFLFDKLYKFLF